VNALRVPSPQSAKPVVLEQGVIMQDDLERRKMQFNFCTACGSVVRARLNCSAFKGATRSGRWQIVLLLGILFLPLLQLACFGQVSPSGCDPKLVFHESDVLLRQRLYGQASAMLKQLDACKNLSQIDRFNLGWFYGRTHDFDSALRIFSSVSPNIPDPQTHQYAVALTQFELADYKGTVETLKPQAGQRPLTAESANLLAVTYAKLGSYEDANSILREELKRNRLDRIAYLNLVTLLCDQGRLSDAAGVAGDAVAAFPRDSEVLVVRGAAYTLLGEVAKAQTDFENAIRISPRQAAPRFFLAVSNYKQGKYAAVVKELSESTASGVNDSDLHYLLAEAELRLDPGNLQVPMQELNRAIQLNGRSASALSLRGKLLLQEHHVEAAVTDLELAHSIDPESRNATYNLARAYFAQGKKQEASELFALLKDQNVDPVDEMSERRLKDALRGENASQP